MCRANINELSVHLLPQLPRGAPVRQPAGAVPAAALALALYPDKDVRTAATAVAAASAVAGQVAAMAGPADGKLSQRVPASMTIGLLMLQAVRLGCSSAMPSYGEHGCLHTTLLARVSPPLCVQMPATPPGPSSTPTLDTIFNISKLPRRRRVMPANGSTPMRGAANA